MPYKRRVQLCLGLIRASSPPYKEGGVCVYQTGGTMNRGVDAVHDSAEGFPPPPPPRVQHPKMGSDPHEFFDLQTQGGDIASLLRDFNDELGSNCSGVTLLTDLTGVNHLLGATPSRSIHLIGRENLVKKTVSSLFAILKSNIEVYNITFVHAANLTGSEHGGALNYDSCLVQFSRTLTQEYYGVNQENEITAGQLFWFLLAAYREVEEFRQYRAAERRAQAILGSTGTFPTSGSVAVPS